MTGSCRGITLTALTLAIVFGDVSARAVQLTQLTFGAPPPYEAYQEEPAWSPDGTSLACTFKFWQPGQFEPYFTIGIITSSGGPGPSFDPPVWLPSHATWSSDGARIAFSSSSGLEVAPIADPPMTEQLFLQSALNPAWSPVAEQIAFESNGQIVVIAATGGAATPLPTSGGQRPAWAADASKLAYDAGGRIWVLDLVALTTTPITSGSTTDQHPTWSPDGSWIAFTSRRSGNAALWVVAASGGAPIQLTSGATDDYDPAWSPDGDRIAFTSGRGGAGPHVWIATDLPDFTVAVRPTTWTTVKTLYRP